MSEQEAGNYWNDNAEAWTTLSRAGFDVYRDYVNTPAFFAALPEVRGLRGLDAGCGEGHNTRLLARLGALLDAIDVSERFIRCAQEEEAREPLGVRYAVASAQALPFAGETFDFATAIMCLMDVPEPEEALREAFRVLKPGGFLQFSVSHPCFTTPHRKNLRNAEQKTYAIEVGDYFRRLNGEIEEWIFNAAPPELKKNLPKFQIPRFTRTLSEWINAVVGAGFALEWSGEPRPDDETARRIPAVQDAQVTAYFWHLRCRKPRAAHTASTP